MALKDFFYIKELDTQKRIIIDGDSVESIIEEEYGVEIKLKSGETHKSSCSVDLFIEAIGFEAYG